MAVVHDPYPLQSEKLDKFMPAFLKFQKKCEPPKMDSSVEHSGRKYKYASLKAVCDAIDPVLHENDLSYRFQKPVGGKMLITTLEHVPSGQFLKTYWDLHSGTRPQDQGSEQTYGKRYSITLLTGVVAEEDDDGQAAQKSNGANNRGQANRSSDNNGHHAQPKPAASTVQPGGNASVQPGQGTNNAGKTQAPPVQNATKTADETERRLAELQKKRDAEKLATQKGTTGGPAKSDSAGPRKAPEPTNPGDYVVQIRCSFKGKKLKDIDPAKLMEVANHCAQNNEAKKDGTKPFDGFLNAIKAFETGGGK